MNNKYTTIKVIADDDYFNDEDIQKAKDKLKRVEMQKPTIETKVTHKEVKFTILGYRKLTKDEVLSTLANFYKKKQPKKGESYILETIFGFDQ